MTGPSSRLDGSLIALGRRTLRAIRSSLVGLVISYPFQWSVVEQGSLYRTGGEEFLEEDTDRTLSRSWVPGTGSNAQGS